MNRNALLNSTVYFAPPDAPGGGAPAPEPAAAVAMAPAAPAAEVVPAAAAVPAAEPAAVVAEPVAATVAEPAVATEPEKKPDAAAVKPHSETKSALSSDAAAEPKKEDGKVADPAAVVDPAAAVVAEPVVYEFKLPEGVKVDDKAIGDFKTVLAENKIPPELGQKFVDMHLGAMQKFANSALQQQNDAFGKMRADWIAEVKADEQMGGSGYETTKKNAVEMIERFVPKENRAAFDQMMDTTGVGDHPEFWRFLSSLSKRFKEPTPLPSDIGKPPKDIGGKPKGGRKGLYDHPTSARMAGG